MTSQIQQAMQDYPDELKVVMEASGYRRQVVCDWVWADGSDQIATDNDAIVAAIEWLVKGNWEIDLCEWTTTGLLIQALELVRQAIESNKRFAEVMG